MCQTFLLSLKMISGPPNESNIPIVLGSVFLCSLPSLMLRLYFLPCLCIVITKTILGTAILVNAVV